MSKIIFLNPEEYDKKELPEIGKVYYHYDDGKIKLSRQYQVLITEIIPFAEVDEKLKSEWKEDVGYCDWLYAPETDYFIVGKAVDPNFEDDEDDEPAVYVRTKSGGWVSLGYWAGRLDIDGKLTEQLNEWLEEHEEELMAAAPIE